MARILVSCAILALCLGAASSTPIDQPYVSVRSGDNGCPIALGNATADDRLAIQCQVDYIANTYNSGYLYAPCGYYMVSAPGIMMKKGVTLFGCGNQGTTIASVGDNTVLTFDVGVAQGGIRDIMIAGYMVGNPGTPAIRVGINVPVIFRDCIVLGGNWAMKTAGVDGHITNCGFAGWHVAGGGIDSTGANWYTRVKLDSQRQNGFAFFQEASTIGPTAENHFTDCDFSGPNYLYSVVIDDGGQGSAVTVFNGGVFSSPFVINNAKATLISTAEVGAAITHNSGALVVSGNWAFNPTSVSGSGFPRACGGANINIIC